MKTFLSTVLLLFPALATAQRTLLRHPAEDDDVMQQRRLNAQVVRVGALPMQTFFVPLPEESLFKDLFLVIQSNSAIVKAPVVSILAISVSVDKTVIWYDHWEDGFEEDVTMPNSTTTRIWGDGDSSNGCAPNVVPADCTDANDILEAGDSIVIQNNVEVPRNQKLIKYDGGDKLQASYPVTMTRGAFPKGPGSQLAGGVEVSDVDEWGQNFEAPMGEDIGKTIAESAFEYVAMFYMAAFDNTTVTLPKGSLVTLNAGEGRMVRVNRGDKLTADKVIQVDYIAGDIASSYELRWFSLLDTSKWSFEYITPVGDTYASTKVLLYNPAPFDTVIWVVTRDPANLAKKITAKVTVKSRSHALTDVIPTGMGAKIKSFNMKDVFLALSLTDTAAKTYEDGVESITAGQWYDWGYPVIPSNKLTSEVLVGWGYGCTNNQCWGQTPRSVVWVTPAQDADIYIDYQNTGNPQDYVVFPTQQLASMRFSDPVDTDMSGAVIFATVPNSGWGGPPVDIAAAWGQDPSVSKKYQDMSMDLGTAVLPFTTVRATKVADKDTVAPGEVLTYTIRVSNAGNNAVASNTLLVKDTLDAHVQYVPDSTLLIMDGKAVSSVKDNGKGTPFPLDAGGYFIPLDIKRRGGTADIQFQVTVDSLDNLGDSTSVVNVGSVKQSGATNDLPFSVETPIFFATPEPSAAPSQPPSVGPSASPSQPPSVGPSASPSQPPSVGPTTSPTAQPTVAPTSTPTAQPTVPPTASPTAGPTAIPTELPTVAPIVSPTQMSTPAPTLLRTTSAPISMMRDNDPRMGEKQNCLQDEWTDAGNVGDLLCTSDEVLFEELSSMPATCVPGTMIRATVNAKIRVNGSKYDIGWYVTVDDGDALQGTCVAAGMQKVGSEEYSVDATTAGNGGVVSFCDTEVESDNTCGDVLLYSNVESATVWVPLLVETDVPCLDENSDGKLDLTVCLSWRTEETDVDCALDGETKVGIYPSSPSACNCETYDVPQINVLTVEDVVAPCS